jgi:Asp-tRNA(Asn)/Glu-tRNA(Gln) amidotransferase A subunit family amidase
MADTGMARRGTRDGPCGRDRSAATRSQRCDRRRDRIAGGIRALPRRAKRRAAFRGGARVRVRTYLSCRLAFAIGPRGVDGGRGDSAARAGSAGIVARCRTLFAAAIAPFDLLLAASAPGEAPAGLGNTGEAMFNRWSSGLLVPCLNLPGFTGPNGLPVGVQVIGALDDDARLLRAAKWIAARVGDAADTA